MNPARILVINVTRIGDTLLMTPALRAIAAHWPNAQIDVLAHPKRKEVLENLPFVHRVGAITKRTARYQGWLARFCKPYDLAFVYGRDAALVAYALRVAKRVTAFRQGKPSLDRRLDPCVEPPPFQSAHAVHLALSLPAALGIAPHGLRLSYAVTENERLWAEKRLAEDLPAAHRPLIGLQIASFPTKAYRDWPVASFVALCARIRAHWPTAHFLILGGPAEQARTLALHTALGAAGTLYAGKLSLRQTGALMSQLDLYIGVDTGPTHLMSAFDKPMIVLYHGFSRSELIAPLDHPCLYAIDHPRAGANCPIEAPMAEISVERVFAAVCKALYEHPPR